MICREVANAVLRYTDVAGQISEETVPGLMMPESFAPAFVFGRLGSELTMTLETNVNTLWKYNQAARGSNEPAPERLRNQRVDLVLYQGNSPKKDEQELFALIEFKLLTLDLRDREKLRNILNDIDTCPNGAICSVLKSDLDLLLEEKQAIADGDHWYRYDVPALPHSNTERFSVCARAFQRRPQSHQK